MALRPSERLMESPFRIFISNLSPLSSGKAPRYTQSFSQTNIPSPSPVFATPHMDHERPSSFIQSKESDAANSNVYTQNNNQSSSPSGCIDEYLADHVDMEGTPSSLPSILQGGNCVHKFSESGFSDHRHEENNVNDAITGNTRAKMMSGQTSEEPPFVQNTTHVRFNDSMDVTSTKVSDLESDTFLGTFSGGEHGKSLFFQGSDHQERTIRRHLQFGISLACTNTRNESEDAPSLGSPAGCMNYEADVSYGGELRGNSSGQQIDSSLRVVNSLSPFNPSESFRTAQNSGNNTSQACIPSDMGLHLNSADRSMFGGSESTASKKLAGNNCVHAGGNQQGSQAVMTASPSASEFNNTMQPRCNSLEMTLFEQHAPSKERMESYRMSPQKNRKKGKYSTESSDCKRCNCKRSKCLKLYCECFASGVFCLDTCSCENCYNKPIYEDSVAEARKAVLVRNPNAFQSKIVNHDTDFPENMVDGTNWTTPASARHKTGCNCKKSKCLKKYCECYQAGVGCSDGCRCEGCKNSHGKKSEIMCRRTERWENPSHEHCMKTVSDIQSLPTWENVVDVTPLNKRGYSRVLQPQSFHEPGGHSFPGCSKWNLRHHSPDSLYNTLHGDDIPDALKNTSTPTKGVQITSPNKKRVSPPSSKGMRSGRIQDIPPFPPLTPYSNSKETNHSNDGDGEEGSRSKR